MMGWAKEILLAEEQAEIIGNRVAEKISPAPLKAPRITRFPDPYQRKVVEAGEREEVFYFKVPEGMVGWIQYVGNNYYLNTKLYWWVDGKLVISPYIERSLGFVNTPLPIVPWKRVNEYVRWEVKNDGDEDREMEVLNEGFYCPIEDVSILLKQGLPVSR